MIVTAMLAFFDEPAALLRQAVSSTAGFCDRVVAVDGGYRLTPGAKLRSPKVQHTTLRKLGCELYAPDHLWRGQVQKRDMMLRVAAEDSDWVMPLDADWKLEGNKTGAREFLRGTGADSLVVEFHTPKNPDRSLDVTSSTVWHTETVGTTFLPLVYRVLPCMRQVDHHWFYSGLRDNTRVAYWGTDGHPAASEKLPGVRIQHLCHFRDDHRIDRNRSFCAERDRQVHRTGVEA